MASLWYLRPRDSLLPSQNQPFLPAAKQWSSIPNTAMNSLGGKQGARSAVGRELGDQDGGDMGYLLFKEG